MFSLSPEYEQASFIEQVNQTRELTNRNPVKFLHLLKEHFDLPTMIPMTFYMAYNSSGTKPREYSLESMLAIMLLIHFFKFPNPANFITLLYLSPIAREFCRLPEGNVPDESCISKFKTAFDNEFRLFFENLSRQVMDLFAAYDASLPEESPEKGLAATLIPDTTGLKPKVRENNPKTLQSEVNRQDNVKKFLESKGQGKNFSIHAAAFKNMPKYARANDAIRLTFANGHFGYFYKFGMLSNGFGIPLHIRFFEKDFYDNLSNDFESPEEHKSAFDNASLYPLLTSFYKCAGGHRFSTFIGDSEFDSYDNYGLLHELNFNKVLIPINNRNTTLDNQTIPINPDGIPCCPKDSNLVFIADGKCNGKKRSFRLKYVCPKSRKVNNLWVCDCDYKCRDTNSTVTHYTYPSGDLRVFFGIQRGSREWDEEYKKRTVIEREFSSMKSHPALERPNTYNTASLRSDVFLNASSKLITVMLAFALGKPDYMRNLKKLLKTA